MKKTVLSLLSIVLIIIGFVCWSHGMDLKNTRMSEYSRKNVYVGGDAYNYIINGTYFTGYMVLSVGMWTIASILTCGTLLLGKGDEDEDQRKGYQRYQGRHIGQERIQNREDDIDQNWESEDTK